MGGRVSEGITWAYLVGIHDPYSTTRALGLASLVYKVVPTPPAVWSLPLVHPL